METRTRSARGGVLCLSLRSDGSPCQAEALPGSDYCWHHGQEEALPNSTRSPLSAQRKPGLAHTRTSVEALRKLMLYGAPQEGLRPEDALQDELARTAGHVQWLQEQVATSDPVQFVKSLWMFNRQSGYIREDEIDTAAWNAASAIWLDLYMKERTHLVRVASEALRSGIEERKVKLAENIADQLGVAISWMLENLGLDTDDPHVRQVAFKGLMMARGEILEGEVVE